jgi:hypothetical protein
LAVALINPLPHETLIFAPALLVIDALQRGEWAG